MVTAMPAAVHAAISTESKPTPKRATQARREPGGGTESCFVGAMVVIMVVVIMVMIVIVVWCSLAALLAYCEYAFCGTETAG